MLNMEFLLRVVNEGVHVVVNQVVEEVNPPVEVGFDNCGATPEPDFSINEGKPRMHLKPTLSFTNWFRFCFFLLH